MEVLKYAKRLAVRKETVDVPELDGAVVVCGLMACDAFAVQAFRSQALRRLREEAAERRAAPAQGLLPDKPAALPQPDPTDQAAQLTFDELADYGRYVSHLLAAAVTGAHGQRLGDFDYWEVFGQHYPRAWLRLQAVAERLSGLHAEDVEKN